MVFVSGGETKYAPTHKGMHKSLFLSVAYVKFVESVCRGFYHIQLIHIKRELWKNVSRKSKRNFCLVETHLLPKRSSEDEKFQWQDKLSVIEFRREKKYPNLRFALAS